MADRPGSGNGPDTSPPPAAGVAPNDEGLDLKARLDRFGDLLGKGLDLAEAGLSLGLTVASTLGAAAQQKIIEKLMEATAPEPATPAPPPAAPSPGPGASPAQPQTFGITNRLRLAPGMPVNISFSINNDSGTAPKQVTLRAEPFTGERTGALLPPSALSVAPDSATIAPMDFEKFVLRGAIPDSSPTDIYHGSIAVTADESVRIPVVLVIEA
jgi:hypothetical protein